MTKRYLLLLVALIVLTIRVSTYLVSQNIITQCSEQCVKYPDKGHTYIERIRDIVYKTVSERIFKLLPSPHADLILGLTLGFDNLSKNTKFKEYLKSTGTIHVVVVSGFNITLVLSFISKFIESRYTIRGFIKLYFLLFLYAIVSGFNPPIVRAYIMSFFQGWGTVSGRKIPIAEILFASGVIMLIIKPSYISDFSFILSFLATLGLCAFSEEIINFFRKFKIDRYQIINDLSSSLAAQLLVWPVISFNFGEFSIVSLLANMLTLWTIPVSTILGFILLVFLFVPGPGANILAALVYPFLDIFVSLVKILGSLPFSSMQLRIGLFTLATYYIGIFIFYRILRANRNDTRLP